MIRHTQRAGKPALSTKLAALAQDSPHISSSDAAWTRVLFDASAGIQYPVNSAAELVRYFGGKDASLSIAKHSIRPARLLKRFAPHNFPIVSFENFAEKVAAARAAQRKTTVGPAVKVERDGARPSVKIERGAFRMDIEQIRAQLPALRFPVADADALVRELEHNGPFRFRNRQFDVRKLREILPSALFPIHSVNDLLGIAAVALKKLSASGKSLREAAASASVSSAPSAASDRVAFARRDSSRFD